MEQLKTMHCVPCRGDEPAVTGAELEAYRQQIPEWQVAEEEGISRLRRAFKFKNFRRALDFTNRIGELAESQDHHPVILTEWGKVTLTWWTHAIKGLHRNDFIMATKSDEVYREAQGKV